MEAEKGGFKFGFPNLTEKNSEIRIFLYDILHNKPREKQPKSNTFFKRCLPPRASLVYQLHTNFTDPIKQAIKGIAMTFNIVTLFPEFFASPLKTGVLGRAVARQLLQVRFVNPRDFAKDIHKTVDDSPFGGGDGMVMLYQPLKEAVESLPARARKKIVYLSPQGQKWNYKKAREWAEQAGEWTLISGRYAGVDQRFVSEYVTEEISVGDYVLTGGEPATLIILDSLARFVKGVLGNELSMKEESFENRDLLEAPQWTRPREIEGYKIPELVFSGHHKKIREFRYLLSVLVTALKRPSLLQKKDKQMLGSALKMAESFSQEELSACGLNKENLKTADALFKKT